MKIYVYIHWLFAASNEGVRSAFYYLPMDEVIGDQLIGEQINLTLFYNPSLVSGVSGQAISFNGLNQSATFSDQIHPCLRNPVHIDCPNGFSVSFWIKISSIQTGNKITFAGRGCMAGGTGFCLNRVGGRINWGINSELWIDGIKFLPTTLYDTWTSLGATWSAASGLQVYVNGRSILDQSDRYVWPNPVSEGSPNFYFGRSGASGTPGRHLTKYAIDEFYFWPELKCADFMFFIYDYTKPWIYMITGNEHGAFIWQVHVPQLPS